MAHDRQAEARGRRGRLSRLGNPVALDPGAAVPGVRRGRGEQVGARVELADQRQPATGAVLPVDQLSERKWTWIKR